MLTKTGLPNYQGSILYLFLSKAKESFIIKFKTSAVFSRYFDNGMIWQYTINWGIEIINKENQNLFLKTQECKLCIEKMKESLITEMC